VESSVFLAVILDVFLAKMGLLIVVNANLVILYRGVNACHVLKIVYIVRQQGQVCVILRAVYMAMLGW